MVIAGVDEVGRGAWAGPIVAAAVILNEGVHGLKDSKQLGSGRRIELSHLIYERASVSIAALDAHQIDQLGIAEANRLVMRQAITGLATVPNMVRVDGFSCGTEILEEVYVRGDQLFPEISAASIVAKVYRDQMMKQLHVQDSRYGFDRHVGYGTQFHRQCLDRHGVSGVHRRTFAPMKHMIYIAINKH